MARRFLRELHDHFVPHAGNSHTPHVLQHHVLFGYATLLVLVKVLAVVVGVVLPSSSLYSSAVTPENIVRLTNEARTAAGLPELAVEIPLAKAAQAKARDMLANQYFAHTSPAGVTPWSWIRTAGYAYRHAGENLAINFLQAEDVEAGWMASPSHRANILDTRYQHIGVAVLQGEYQGKDTFVVVQMFGTPKEVAATSGESSAPAGVQVAPVTQPTPEVAVPAPQPSAPVVVAAQPQSAPAAPLTVALVAPPTHAPQAPTSDNEADAAPIVTPPVAAREPALQIDGASARIVPSTEGYDVNVRVAGATTVAAYLGDRWATLQPDAAEPTLWAGTVPAPAATGSADALVVATGKGGQQVSSPVAWVAPGATAATTFAPATAQRSFKFFGVLTVEGLEDRVRQFYVAAMAVLAGALLVSFMAKFQVQRHATLVHCLAVMFLAGVLAIA